MRWPQTQTQTIEECKFNPWFLELVVSCAAAVPWRIRTETNAPSKVCYMQETLRAALLKVPSSRASTTPVDALTALSERPAALI